MAHSHILKLAAWNIHGIGKKLEDDEFVNRLNEFQICFLLETWCTKQFSLPNKYVYCKNAVEKNCNAGGRYSGGIAIIIDEQIRKGVKIFKESDYGVWIKLDKHYFNIEQNVYMYALYLPPVNSPYAMKLPYDCIERDLVDLCSDGNVLILGDTNSRTADMIDYIKFDKNDNHLNFDSHNFNSELPERFNDDGVINVLGKQLTEFCMNCQLYIVNGRTRGDIPGKVTCVQSTGCSTVDYAIASTNLKEIIKYFSVTPIDCFSDHSLIKVGINLPVQQRNLESKPKWYPLPCRYIWNAQSKDKFLTAFNYQVVQSEMEHVLQNTFTNTLDGIESLCKNVTHIYQKDANIGLSKANSKKKHRNKVYNWQANKT
jgi:hypothetical protein